MIETARVGPVAAVLAVPVQTKPTAKPTAESTSCLRDKPAAGIKHALAATVDTNAAANAAVAAIDIGNLG